MNNTNNQKEGGAYKINASQWMVVINILKKQITKGDKSNEYN